MFTSKIKLYLLCGFAILSVTNLFFSGFCNAANDLLWDVFQPTNNNGNIIDLGENVDTVGGKVIKGTTEIGAEGVSSGNSIILKVTRLILILTIALSVTMILYHGLNYIIDTGQGKEGKGLIKNVLFIVIGILVSLFSVVIINLIQSIPTTLDEELKSDTKHEEDMEALKGKKMSWKEVGQSIKDMWNSIRHKKHDENNENPEDTKDIDMDKIVQELEDRCTYMGGEFKLGITTETGSTYICDFPNSDGTREVITVPNKGSNN